jgi:hypothetical protein
MAPLKLILEMQYYLPAIMQLCTLPLAVGLVRLPVRKLARLLTVLRLRTPRALHNTSAVTTEITAMRLGLTIRGVLGGSTG